MAPIEKPKTGPDLKSPVELDRLSADVQKVQRALDRAAGYIGGEVYERWNKNAGRREIVTAVAETLPDGRTRFLPAGTEGKLQLVRPEFLRRPEELIRIRAALSQEVIDGQKQLDALIAELEGARGTVPEAAQAMEYLRTAKIQDVDTAVEAHFTAWDAALGNAERAAEQSATDTEFLAKLPDIQSYLTPEQLGGAPADQPLGQGLVENVKLAINIFFIEEMRKKLHPSMNLEELGKIQAKLKEQAVAVQQERRLYIAQHSPERERYLHLLGGGTAQEIIEQSKMEPGTENSAVDIELLAAHLTGISRGAVSLDALKQVIAASNIVNLKRQIDAGTLMVALTKDEQAQLADILQEKFHVANPAGISIPELLNRANYPKEFLEKFRAVTEEIPVGMIVSLAKIPVAEWNAQPRSGATCKKLAELCAVPTTIPERTGAYWQIDFDALRDLLVGLNLPDTTLTDADVRVAQEKADAEIRILRSKPMSVIDGKQFMGEEAFFSSLGALQPQTLLSNLSKNPPITAADFPLSERLKMKGNELGETIRYGTEAWWKYIKSLPRIVERDPALLEILDRQRAIGSALHAVDAALQMTDTSTQTAADAKGAMQETQRGREEALRRVPASDRPYAHFREARDLLAVSDEIFQQLDRDYSLSERFSLEEQRMAFWIALQKDVRTAGEYLNTPPAQRSAFLRKLFPSPELGSIAMRNFTQRSTVQERLSGKDVLQPLRTELHVKILAPALALLSGTLGPDGEPLSIDESRISAWMTDPAHAGPALRTILVSEEDAPGNVEALVLAFTENREQRCTFFNPDGTSQERALTPEQARAYIAEVQKHLLQQSRDLQRSTQQAATSERFKNPIEMLRGGAEAIAEMISSGDRVKQGLALTMLVAGGYALYKGWKRAGSSLAFHSSSVRTWSCRT